MKPLLDLDKLRSERPELDEELRAAEEGARERLTALATTATEYDQRCFGVWIDHEDYEGAGPGQTWGQCSRGKDCLFSGLRSRHTDAKSCRLIFLDGCPRCDT